MSRFIKSEGEITEIDLLSRCRRLYPFLRAEYFLHWSEDELDKRCLQILDILKSLTLVSCAENLVQPASPGSDRFASLSQIAEIVEPTLERFHIVNTLLSDHQLYTVSSLESTASAMAEQLSVIYGLNSPDFFDASLFSTYIDSLCGDGQVRIEQDQIHVCESFHETMTLIEQTLATDVRYNVLQAVPAPG